MAAIVIIVNMDNATFVDDPQAELQRILSTVTVEKPAYQKTLRDTNGDYAGSYSTFGSK